MEVLCGGSGPDRPTWLCAGVQLAIADNEGAVEQHVPDAGRRPGAARVGGLVQPRQRDQAILPPVLPGALLARARELDARHRVSTGGGRPVSRDTLREQLRIGRDRASALIAAVRAEAAATAEPSSGPLQAA